MREKKFDPKKNPTINRSTDPNAPKPLPPTKTTILPERAAPAAVPLLSGLDLGRVGDSTPKVGGAFWAFGLGFFSTEKNDIFLKKIKDVGVVFF